MVAPTNSLWLAVIQILIFVLKNLLLLIFKLLSMLIGRPVLMIIRAVKVVTSFLNRIWCHGLPPSKELFQGVALVGFPCFITCSNTKKKKKKEANPSPWIKQNRQSNQKMIKDQYLFEEIGLDQPLLM